MEWNLKLDQYQRDNLLWLLQLCGYYHFDRKVEPFHLAHTGDWLGEIHNMLADEEGEFNPRRANRTVEELWRQVEIWKHNA